MVFKLLEAAHEHWRNVNGAHLVALVRAGVGFEQGVLLERPENAAEVGSRIDRQSQGAE